MNLDKFGERLADLRDRSGVSQGELAGAAGLKRGAVALVERQGTHPRLAAFQEYVNHLDLTDEELLWLLGRR